jgi:Holliday junction resolvasome RuvABC DNA-binding subunit
MEKNHKVLMEEVKKTSEALLKIGFKVSEIKNLIYDILTPETENINNGIVIHSLMKLQDLRKENNILYI